VLLLPVSELVDCSVSNESGAPCLKDAEEIGQLQGFWS
jgi:hypothetical protein